LAVPFALSLTGCGEKDDGPKTQVLTEAEQNTAYSKLRTVASKPFYNTTNQNASEFSTKIDISMGGDVDYSKSGLTQSQIDSLNSDNFESVLLDFDLFSMGAKLILGYDSSNNTGYMKTYVSVPSLGLNDVFQGHTVTTKNNSEYFNYVYVPSSDTKEIEKVDEHYAKNTYTLEGLFSQYEEYKDALSLLEMLNSITECETLEDFKEKATDYSTDYYSESGFEAIGEMDLSDVNVSSVIGMTLTDGVYELKLEVDIDDFKMEIDGSDANVDMSSDIAINFTEKEIVNISMNVDLDAETSMKTADAGVEGDFTDNNVIVTDIEMSTGVSMTTGDFDYDIITKEFKGYAGTGENGAVENRTTAVRFQCKNYPELSLEGDWASIDDSNECTFGDNIIATFNELVDEDYLNLNIKLYWDSECTNEIESTDVIPSYDTTIYFTVEPKEGYAVVNIMTEVEEYFMSDNKIEVLSISEPFVFADHKGIYSTYEVSKVIVNGETVSSDSMQLENGKFYNVVIYLIKD
jgi:hypothetical protein